MSLLINDEYRTVLAALDDFFEREGNPLEERAKFRQMRQEPRENAKAFVMRLRTQASHCRFVDVDDQVQEQFTIGCADANVKERILENSLTLEAAVRLATKRELVSANLKRKPLEVEMSEINRVATSTSKRLKTNWRCHFCGDEGHFSRQCEKRKRYRCKICDKYGHNEKACFKRRRDDSERSPVRRVKEEKPTTTEYIFFVEGEERRTLKVGGVVMSAMVDSGTKSNIIPEKHWLILKAKGVQVHNQNQDVDRVFKAYASEEPLETVGSFDAEVVSGQRRVKARFYVLKHGDIPLLGSRTAKELDILNIKEDEVME